MFCNVQRKYCPIFYCIIFSTSCSVLKKFVLFFFAHVLRLCVRCYITNRKVPSGCQRAPSKEATLPMSTLSLNRGCCCLLACNFFSNLFEPAARRLKPGFYCRAGGVFPHSRFTVLLDRNFLSSTTRKSSRMKACRCFDMLDWMKTFMDTNES